MWQGDFHKYQSSLCYLLIFPSLKGLTFLNTGWFSVVSVSWTELSDVSCWARVEFLMPWVCKKCCFCQIENKLRQFRKVLTWKECIEKSHSVLFKQPFLQLLQVRPVPIGNLLWIVVPELYRPAAFPVAQLTIKVWRHCELQNIKWKSRA